MADISRLICELFNTAKLSKVDLFQRWIQASLYLGGKLPQSEMVIRLQTLGDIDILIRNLEEETQAKLNNDYLQTLHYQSLLSKIWIGEIYEVFRTLREKSCLEITEEFQLVFKDLEILRVTLEKHEIAKDRKLKSPIEFTTYPDFGKNLVTMCYDSKDIKRTHIMPSGISHQGSVMWQVFDIENGNKAYWVERLELSNRILFFIEKTK